jgi:replicative DNA helicase
MAERTPPWDEEAEVNVLGACLIDRDAMVQAAALIRPEDFYREAHRRIYRAMLAVTDRGEPSSDIPILGAELASRGELEQVGGLPYFGELLDAVPTAANVSYHCRLVADCAQRRQLIVAGTEIVRFAYEPDGLAVTTLVDRAEQLVFACGAAGSGGTVSVRAAMDEAMVRLDEVRACPGGITGIGTGFPDLDNNTDGWQRGDLVILGARPSMGKTAFAIGSSVAAAMVGHGVLINSLEMSRVQIASRMLCHEGCVDILHLSRGQLSHDEDRRLVDAAGALYRLPIRIHEGAATVAQLRAEARRLQAEMPELAMIVVDYIGLMDGEGERQDLRIGSITKGLKRLAREMDVVLLALCQLSRSPLNRAEHRPHLADLRDSGNIEQDADVVGFLHRPEYYLQGEEQQKVAGQAEFIIGKQRNGPTGTIDLKFTRECARFDAAPGWGVPLHAA